MDYKERYMHALEKIREGLQPLPDGAKISGVTRAFLEEVFPELQESEDERIRKALVRFHKSTIDVDGIKGEEIVAWLEKQGERDARYENLEELLEADTIYQMAMNDAMVEGAKTKAMNALSELEIGKLLGIEKQGEKKPTDKVEPKFKVGDWIITKDKNVHKDYSICKIVEIENNRYHLENGDYLDIDTLEQYDYYLWTIQDAKDGDVLACGDKVTDCPFIFHNLTEEQNPRSYCGVNTLCHFQDNDENGGFWCKSDEVRPATKEQRDLLFQKIREAGYEWDAEKKELKLLISNGGDFESNNSKQKPTWSEEDDAYKLFAISAVEDYYDVKNPLQKDLVDWLKSLKERLS